MSAGHCLDCQKRLTVRNAYRRGKELQLRCKVCDNKNRVERSRLAAAVTPAAPAQPPPDGSTHQIHQTVPSPDESFPATVTYVLQGHRVEYVPASRLTAAEAARDEAVKRADRAEAGGRCALCHGSGTCDARPLTAELTCPDCHGTGAKP
jgi:hypothetical protein